ncbi:MAG: hypothetical protein K9K76_07060 [Halanaerobiales bacterium]|nr:hypothetical protein [Halanaerobiales bacterium]
MKKLAFIIIIILILFNSMAFGSDFKVGNNNIDFDITPDILKDNSYIPIDQFKNMEDFYFEELNNDKHLIIYKNNFYIFTFNNNLVKSSEGNIQLKYKPLQINERVLVPFEFLKMIFKDKIEMNDKTNNNKLELSLNMEDKINKNDNLALDIEISNQSKEKITLEFSSSQKYNIIIRDQKDKIVYNWAENKMFTQAFEKKEIKANSVLKFKEVIDLSELASGEYLIEVNIVAENYEIKSKTKKIVIK